MKSRLNRPRKPLGWALGRAAWGYSIVSDYTLQGKLTKSSRQLRVCGTDAEKHLS